MFFCLFVWFVYFVGLLVCLFVYFVGLVGFVGLFVFSFRYDDGDEWQGAAQDVYLLVPHQHQQQQPYATSQVAMFVV